MDDPPTDTSHALCTQSLPLQGAASFFFSATTLRRRPRQRGIDLHGDLASDRSCIEKTRMTLLLKFQEEEAIKALRTNGL